MKLTYSEEADRYNDFHCGECFKIKINDKWKNVRIEMGAKGWYMIDEDNFTALCKNFEGYEIEE
ncbi:MAG: DUF5348 domain-containing protein [Clostridia bacterium]|nr:DUF5348 domain-containing protein [Clostridia bacterium]